MNYLIISLQNSKKVNKLSFARWDPVYHCLKDSKMLYGRGSDKLCQMLLTEWARRILRNDHWIDHMKGNWWTWPKKMTNI